MHIQKPFLPVCAARLKHIDSENGDNIIQIPHRFPLLWECSQDAFKGNQE